MGSQGTLPTLRSYLTLYTSISIKKFASFLNMEEEDCKQQLLCYKHQMRQRNADDASGGGGGSTSGNNGGSAWDVNFYIKDGTIAVIDSKAPHRYADFFARHIVKYEQIIKSASSTETGA